MWDSLLFIQSKHLGALRAQQELGNYKFLLKPTVFVSGCCCNNCRKLSSLKQHTCIHSQFWRSEIRNGFYWSTNEGTGRAGFLAHFLSFPASRSCLWPCITWTSTSVPSSHLLWLTSPPPTSLYKDLGNYAGLTGKIQHNLYNSTFLT